MDTLKVARWILAVAWTGLLLAGCGSIPVARQIALNTTAGNYSAALSLLDQHKQQYSGPNNLIYYFDRGSLLQRLGDYAASNTELETADKLIDDLYGTSVSQAAASFLINDMTMDYTGEDFEQVMVNVVKELNYLYARDLDGALVEARKVDTRLVRLAGKYGDEAVYQQDAFARYLAGFAHEAEGNLNDAYIDYKKAYQAYQGYEKKFGFTTPRMVKNDLVRLSRWLDFSEDHEKWLEAFGGDLPDQPRHRGGRRAKRCEVLVVVYDGIAPAKHTDYLVAHILDPDEHPYALKVAFPAFQLQPPVVETVRVGLPNGEVAESELMEPLDLIAVATLKQRIGAISAKAIARATAKYIAAYQTRKALKSGDEGVNLLVGLATNVFTYATEQADTRSWRTLPGRFHLIRMELPAGKHELEVRLRPVRGENSP